MEKIKPEKICCSFCGKDKSQVGSVVTTHSGATICIECLTRFKEKIGGDKQEEVIPSKP
jgi:ATP-dependent protease Clp ATPase subunit